MQCSFMCFAALSFHEPNHLSAVRDRCGSRTQSMNSCQEEIISFKAPKTINSAESSFLADNLPIVVHYFF